MSAAHKTGRQDWSAASYARNARFVSNLGGDVLALAAVAPGMRVLDLGCGDGVLTEALVAAGADVIAVDASPDMVEAARARGLDARVMSGEALAFEGEFDLVFSNAALHWMTDADAVVAGVHRALVPGGRFVAEMGGHLNVASLATAMRAAAMAFGGDPALAHPWYFPSPDEHAARLEAAGFEVRSISLHPRPTPLPTGIEGWLETFRRPFFEQFEGETRGRVLEFVVDALRPSLADGRGAWTADYVRLRFEAVRA